MSLSCDCGYNDFEWFYCGPDDYTLLDTSRRQRCYSCKELIGLGYPVLVFQRYREPKDEIEDRIYGEGGEIALANYYMCEECGDLYWSLVELGFCISFNGESMQELVRQYNEEYK